MVTTATRGTQNVIHLVSDPARAAKRRSAAAKAIDSAKQQMKDTTIAPMTET